MATWAVGSLSACNKDRPEPQRFHDRLEIGEMLFRQDFGGNHEGRLVTGSTSHDDGVKRDHRFPGPDIALHQAIHRP